MTRSSSTSIWARRLDRAGLLLLGASGLGLGVAFANSGVRPVDADMVWRVAAGGIHYGSVWGADLGSRYVYPPTLAQVVVALRPIGWSAFVVLWETLLFVALWAATREWALCVAGVSFGSMLFLGMGSPLANPATLAVVGNIQSVVAASIVIGIRRPGAWPLVALTKMFPALGVLWFATRARWRLLVRAAALTGAVAAASYVAAPASWAEFIGFAVRNASTVPPEPVIPIPLLVRLPLVTITILWAARHDKAWLVPIAVSFASPALYTWSWVSLSIGALPLLTRPTSNGARTR